eukprot:366336-Chlamydomonas_euryale.AAC.25
MSERAVLGQVDAPSQSATLAGCSLISTLCSMVGSGEPHAILALHCLGFLTMSQTVRCDTCAGAFIYGVWQGRLPCFIRTEGCYEQQHCGDCAILVNGSCCPLDVVQQVSKLVCSAGLVPLLLGQLRIASSMEPPLVEAALSLGWGGHGLSTLGYMQLWEVAAQKSLKFSLLALVYICDSVLALPLQVDVQDAMHPLLNRHASSLVKVAAFFLQPDHQKQCAVLAAQLVEDLSSTYKVRFDCFATVHHNAFWKCCDFLINIVHDRYSVMIIDLKLLYGLECLE